MKILNVFDKTKLLLLFIYLAKTGLLLYFILIKKIIKKAWSQGREKGSAQLFFFFFYQKTELSIVEDFRRFAYYLFYVKHAFLFFFEII